MILSRPVDWKTLNLVLVRNPKERKLWKKSKRNLLRGPACWGKPEELLRLSEGGTVPQTTSIRTESGMILGMQLTTTITPRMREARVATLMETSTCVVYSFMLWGTH